MFEKFGEFGSAEEMNRAAAAQLAEGDTNAIVDLAEENGIDWEDAKDYIDGVTVELATPLMAAVGKLAVEKKALGISGILADWVEYIEDACVDEPTVAAAVRRKGKSLKMAMAALIRFAYENKVRVSNEIVRATKVTHNGREVPLQKPLYLGIPTRAQAKGILRGYYLDGMGGGGGDGRI